eukprot:1750070-Amphidinium_carterae.1
MEVLLVTLALLVLVEVEEVDVEVVVVHKNTVDEVEVLAVGTMLTEHLTLPLQADGHEDVDANHEFAVEVDVKVDLLEAAENRL